MDMKNIRQLDDGELMRTIEETRDALRTMRFSFATGKLKETSQYGQSRKKLARLLTEKRKRELQTA